MIKNSLVTKIALATFGVALLAIIALSLYAYNSTTKIVQENIFENIRRNVDSEAKLIQLQIKSIKDDVLRISSSSEMSGLMRAWYNGGYDEKENISLVSWKKRVNKQFFTMMQEKNYYVQMRIIMANSQGSEYIRLERINNIITSVKKRKLQNKGLRDYVKNGFETNEGDVYLSKIELNRENGSISIPYLPVLRAITPLNDEMGRLFAILVINIDITKLNSSIMHQQEDESNFFLASENGSYLINYDSNKLFASDLGHSIKLQKDYDKNNILQSTEINNLETLTENVAIVMKKIFFDDNNKERYLVLGMQSSLANTDARTKKLRIELVFIILAVSLFIALLSGAVVSRMTKHLRELTRLAKKIGDGKKVNLDIDSDDEIGVLSHTLSDTLNNLEKSKSELSKFADGLESQVIKKTKELQSVNDTLEGRVSEQLHEVRKKDQMLIQQSRLASMGEMIGNIAHQWRQPLNALSINIQNTQMMYESGDIDKEYMDNNTEKALFLIDKMSSTIDDFRNFFKPDKDKEQFVVALMAKQSELVVDEALRYNNIKFEIKGELKIKAFGFKSEFSQVILNIINNSKDAHKQHDTIEPYISITIKDEKEIVVLEIEDNAGGIANDILPKVFDPYFTTKDGDGGTGIGLYMSKVIMEKMDGQINVENIGSGARFIVSIPTFRE